MADRIVLDLESREIIGKKVKTLRRAGIIPLTVYGKGVGPFALQTNAREFTTLYRQAGRTTLIDVNIPNHPSISAFIHLIQRHPVTREILHADLHAVDLKIELTVDVPVHIIGESPLVALGDAVLNLILATVSVKALPTDIPSAVEIDVSGLDDLSKNLFVSDLKIPANTTLVNAPDEIVVSITPATVEEVIEEEPATAEPQLIRETRDEDEGGSSSS